MNEDIDLVNHLRSLASGMPREAAPQLEQRLSAAFRARHRNKSLRVWLCGGAAVAAGLFVGFTLSHKRQAIEPPSERVFTAPGFVALPYAESGVPLEFVVVMRVQMRPSELSALGVAAPPAASATSRFQADVLIGQDGVARAVRLVQ